MTAETRSRSIVVGYDGSAASRAALGHAARRAGADGQIHVVRAYSLPADWYAIPRVVTLDPTRAGRREMAS